MMKRLITVMALWLAMVGIAQAQDFRSYAGIGLGAFGLEESEPGFSQKSTVFGGYIKVGADFNDYLGAELRFGTTGSGSQTNAAGTLGVPLSFTTKLQAKYIISYLAKPQYPITPDFRIYGLLGGTTAKLEATASVLGFSSSVSATKTGFSYGIGGELSLDDNLSIGAEWAQYWKDVTVGPNAKARLWSAVGTLNYAF